MEVLLTVLVVLLGIGLLIGVGYVLVVGGFFAAAILFGFWPALVGIALGVLLGTFGYNDMGVLVALAGIAGEIFWFRKKFTKNDSGGSSGPSRRTLYGEDGKPIGYIDE